MIDRIKIQWISVISLILIGIFFLLRFLNLTADPPVLLQTYGQDLMTDPYYYTWFARNAVLFDNWHLLNYDRYFIFSYTIVSGLSYLIFSLFGVSRLTAHLTSLILHFGGIFFFV